MMRCKHACLGACLGWIAAAGWGLFVARYLLSENKPEAPNDRK